MNVIMLIAVIRAFVGSKPGHPFIVLKRVLLLSSVAYLGRAISVPITMLPSPDMRCVPRLVDGSMFWSVMLMPFGLSHTCADVFYSGHSIPITLSMMFWIDYAPSRREKVCGSLLSVVALLVILCTHFHYTLDVLYGVGLTVIIWRLYHFGLTVPAVVLNSKIYMFWEADAFMEDTDDADTSESSTTPLSMPAQLAGDSRHDLLLIDIEKGHKPVCLQLVSPAEVVSWKLCEEPRIIWARVACDESDHRTCSIGHRFSLYQPVGSPFEPVSMMSFCRLLAAGGACVAALMLNCAVDVWAQYRADRYWPRDHLTGSLVQPSTPLPDLGFELLPYISSDYQGVRIPDVCMTLCVLGAAIMIFVKFGFDQGTIVLKRTLLLGAIGYTGRALSVPMTQLPNPDGSCKAVLDWNYPLLSILLVPFGLAHTCADVFYSGHSISVTLATMVWWDYSSSMASRLFGLVWGLLTLTIIIATHFHYTIDVVYGVVITFAAWRLYHYAMKVPAVMLNSRFMMFWEYDAFPVVPLNARHKTVYIPNLNMHVQLCEDSAPVLVTQSTTEESSLPSAEDKAIPAGDVAALGVINLNFSEDPRILWGLRVAEKPDGGYRSLP
ncbi:hypothetical protein FOZ61_007018 [Perkinsus olseni]|uniref:Sphingomyelin synthase-like domain-containing protein n=1 Tax=Perkinsus olseni TaxID=32597 RepID=A0A7J6LAU4_PEROL|nr:hypothetical protein FOZ61_007018 [Perkinsus olseni]